MGPLESAWTTCRQGPLGSLDIFNGWSMHLGTAADMKGMILATVSPSAPSWETKSSPSAALGSCLTLSVPYEQASPLLVSAPWEPPTSCPSSQVHPPQSVHQIKDLFVFYQPVPAVPCQNVFFQHRHLIIFLRSLHNYSLFTVSGSSVIPALKWVKVAFIWIKCKL